MTARYTGEQVVTQNVNVLMLKHRTFSHKHASHLAAHPLTLLWLETRQCSQTLTRCSKQNKLVTFLFGHLQRPIATCAVLRTNTQVFFVVGVNNNIYSYSELSKRQSSLVYYKQTLQAGTEQLPSPPSKTCVVKRSALNLFPWSQCSFKCHAKANTDKTLPLLFFSDSLLFHFITTVQCSTLPLFLHSLEK